MTHVPRVRSAVLLAALLLAGCTGPEPATPGASGSPTPVAEPSDTASASASTSPSPSSSPTPSVEPPERPAAMDDDGVEGAKAAAEYFALLDTYIMKTNDTDVYEAMSHPMCETCAARLDQAQEIADNGDSFTGGETRATVIQAYAQDGSTTIWPLDVEETATAVSITDQQGREVAAFDQYTDRSRYEMIHDGDGWLVVGITEPK